MRWAALFILGLAVHNNPLLQLPRIYNPPIPFPVTVMRESLGNALQAADYMAEYMNQTAEELQKILSPDHDDWYEEELLHWASSTVVHNQEDIEAMLTLLKDLKQDSIDQGFQQDLEVALQNVDIFSAQLTQVLGLYESLSENA